MEEFQEDEVWAMANPSKDKGSSNTLKSNSKMRKTRVSGGSTSSNSSAWRFGTTSRAIPRANGSGDHFMTRAAALGPPHQSSAPVDVPDWSKILKKNKAKKNLWDDDAACDDDGHVEAADGNEDDEDEEDYKLPPHELLARRFARTQIASFSMCEGGVGRTLKGRDLSNLRNAILTKTGFLE